MHCNDTMVHTPITFFFISFREKPNLNVFFPQNNYYINCLKCTLKLEIDHKRKRQS